MVAEVYRSAAPRLGGYGFALTGTAHDAEELVQAAMVRVLTRRPRLRDPAAIEGYVRATMRTLHIDQIRRETTWRRYVVRQRPAESDRPCDEEIVTRDEVARALDQLPRQAGTAVVLHYLDDLSVADVAIEMHLYEGTVKRYLHLGRERLGTLLGRQDGEGTADDDTVRVNMRRRR
nr:sigma-70 family RNA polymerase sigma factor [Demequina maris]